MELIDRGMLREQGLAKGTRDPRDLAPSDEESSPKPDETPPEPPPRYPGAQGLPLDDSDEGSSGVLPDRPNLGLLLRAELDTLQADNFSAPTSPEPIQRRQRRMSKVGLVLGLSSKNLLRETIQMKHAVASQLEQEKLEYNHYVDMTLMRKKNLADERGHAGKPPAMFLTSADIPLDLILNDPVHRKTFLMYAESNFCAEPLKFWERVKDFKALPDDQESQRVAMASNIWKNFLDPAAPEQLCVRESLLAPVKAAIEDKNCPPVLFDAVGKEAYSTMQFSLYPDYLAYLNLSRSASKTLPGVASAKARTRDDRSMSSAAAGGVAPRSPRERRLKRSNSISVSADVDVPTLRECLTKPEYRGLFQEFSATLRCEENVVFWQRLAEYESMRDPQQLADRAKEIWTEFLSPSSLRELNVGSKTRKAIRYQVENDLCTSDTFKSAQREIYKLISLDVYPRFCQEYENIFARRRASEDESQK